VAFREARAEVQDQVVPVAPVVVPVVREARAEVQDQVVPVAAMVVPVDQVAVLLVLDCAIV
jgi:hypothetical protein